MTRPAQWASSAMGQAYRKWLAGDIGPDGEQLPLPGMPDPPEHPVYRLFPFLLVNVADRDGRLSPGWPYLARVSGLSGDSVKRHVRRMVACGWLVVESKGHRGHRAVYRLTVPDWAEKGGHLVTPFPGERGSRGSPNGGHLDDPPTVLGTREDWSTAPPQPPSHEQGPPPDWAAPTDGRSRIRESPEDGAA